MSEPNRDKSFGWDIIEYAADKKKQKEEIRRDKRGLTGTTPTTKSAAAVDEVELSITDLEDIQSLAGQGLSYDPDAQNLNVIADLKTGWDNDAGDYITLSFVDGTRTFTVNASADYYYFIAGVELSLASGNYTAVIDDTEGVWYVYFSGGTLIASQTPWNLLDTDKVLVAFIYWDATNNAQITCGWELHGWTMDRATHHYLHFTMGARWESGLAVSKPGADLLDVSNGSFHDEDIEVEIVDDDTPDSIWEQILTPLQAPILYRTGAGGDWRKIAASTTPVYLDANVLQFNDPSWGWTACDLNKYVAYWVLATNCQHAPIVIVPGQEQAATQAVAENANSLADMQFGDLPIAEYVVIARVMVKRIAGGLFYELGNVNDYRNVVDEPSGAFTAVAHDSTTGVAASVAHVLHPLLDGTRDFTGDQTFVDATPARVFQIDRANRRVIIGDPADDGGYIQAVANGLKFSGNNGVTVAYLYDDRQWLIHKTSISRGSGGHVLDGNYGLHMGGHHKIEDYDGEEANLEVVEDGTTLFEVNNTDGIVGSLIKDEDDMASDSATALSTQQSIKKYVDDNANARAIVGYTGSRVDVFLANGALAGGTASAPTIRLLADPEDDCYALFSLNVPANIVTTATLKIRYFMNAIGAYSVLFTIGAITDAASQVVQSTNILNADNGHDFPVGVANTVYTKSIAIDDADLVAGATLGVKIEADAANVPVLHILDLWLEDA